MTQAKMNTIPVPVPSIKEQIEIVQVLNNLIKKQKQASDAANQVIEQIDSMKKAILARAFRGELGTNDPADESAEELLKRVL
ncbi:MAG: restriction endonuclease subunit S [Oscillospiraceae bacterium]|nr:restriction endonuclease subunit S [Oscillospiraceae bacterium]